MFRLVQVATIVLLLMFVFVQIAEARLIRSSGRATVSYQHETDYYFVENADLVELSNFTGMTEEAYFARNNQGFGVTSNTIGGGGGGISAVPTNGNSPDTNCNASYDFGQVAPADAPCEWSITEGEDLTAFGSFSMFFDNPLVDHKVEWTISGNGIVRTIEGLINTGAPIDTPDGVIGTGNVMLNALWSDLDLLPGVYDISVAAFLSSTSGQFLSETRRLGNGTVAEEVLLEKVEENNPAHDEWVILYTDWEINVLFPWQDDPNRQGPEPTFDIPEPPLVLVAYVMQDEGGGFRNAREALDFDSRFSLLQNFPPEILRVEAANNPTNPVNAPSAIVLVLLGGLFAAKRKTNTIKNS